MLEIYEWIQLVVDGHNYKYDKMNCVRVEFEIYV